MVLMVKFHHHHHITQSSHSINAIGPAPLLMVKFVTLSSCSHPFKQIQNSLKSALLLTGDGGSAVLARGKEPPTGLGKSNSMTCQVQAEA
jgi:hypothetical protein